ncbi:MAG: hypothetical protein ACREPW_10090, partial [Candidatus Binataceae bacterium]
VDTRRERTPGSSGKRDPGGQTGAAGSDAARRAAGQPNDDGADDMRYSFVARCEQARRHDDSGMSVWGEYGIDGARRSTSLWMR